MTKRKSIVTLAEVKGLIEQDGDVLRELVRSVVQETLEAEMEDALGAAKGERTASRLGYRSGYYGRTLITRVGKLELRVPQDRAGRFSTQLFERYQRSEKALVAALAEMYIRGVSTRKVKAITEELCGHEFSASAVSAVVKGLDDELAQFASRPLEEAYPYLVLDARYEKVRENGAVRSRAVLIAIGWEGRRQVRPACARPWPKSCPRPSGSAATYIFCATHWIICRNEVATIACGSCAGSTTAATQTRRARTWRLGSAAGQRSIPGCAPGSKTTSRRRCRSIVFLSAITST